MSILITGCNFLRETSNLQFTKSANGPRSGQSNAVEFNQIQKQILNPHCIRCHGEYSNYSTVYSQRKSILRSIERNRMPKNAAPLKNELKQLLKDWINAGAPLNSEVGNPGTKLPSQVGLSDKMKELIRIHSKKIAILDNEKPLNLKKEGEVFRIEKDGLGIAELQYGISETFKFLVRLDLIENTCKAINPQPCFLATHLKLYKKSLNWIKHKDPKKIGKTLEVSGSLPDEDEEEVFYDDADDMSVIGSSVGAFNPPLDSGVKDYLICEDFSFFKDKSVNVISWSSESMVPNKETKVNENRVTGGVYNLKLKKFNQYIYQLGTPEFVESQFNRSSVSTLNGEAGSFIYEDGANQCMVSFKIDINALRGAYSEATSSLENLKYKTFYWEQDGSLVKSDEEFFYSLLKNSIKGRVK